jgi:V8-like Glu-specific endopeptidase
MPTARFTLIAAAVVAASLVPASAALATDQDAENRAAVERILALPQTTDMGFDSSAGARSESLAGTQARETGSTTATETPRPVPAQPTPEPAPAASPQPVQPAPAPATRKRAKPRHGTTCTRTRRARTCVTYRNGKLTKHCVTHRGKRTRCKRPAVGARATALAWQGFINPIAQVGQIHSVKASGKGGRCSGTVVGRALVLTAAHCVYENGYHRSMYFVPASTQSGSTYAAPYGTWTASRWWAPPGYRSGGDMSQDYALVEIAPLNGAYIGDKLGWFAVSYGANWSSGRRAYNVGYPVTGWFGSDGRNGSSQYACDTTYDSYAAVGSGYRLWSQCTMNGGASGGPWLVVGSDNRWYVGGVNSTCDGPASAVTYCDPHSWKLSSSYFDNRFIDFWNWVASIRV